MKAWLTGAATLALLASLARIALAASQPAPVSISASVDDSNPYVQAQVVLTIRIVSSVALLDSSLSPPQVANARLQMLGRPRQSQLSINGSLRDIAEVRYAIFPQHSGQLTISGEEFSAVQWDSGDNEASVATNGRPGELIRVRAADIHLNVKPKPASYPKDAPWLPARALSLSETWHPQSPSAQVGDSLTRTLTLRAQGLSYPQLPPIPQPTNPSVRDYADQPTLLNQIDRDGLTAIREESHALVPSQAGELNLPALEVVWWNTQEDRLERARLPSRSIPVAPSPASIPPVDASPAQEPPSPSQSPWPWQLASLLLTLTSLCGLLLWWRNRGKMTAAHSPRSKTVAVNSEQSVQQRLLTLQNACAANDPERARQALDRWAKAQPQTLASLAAHSEPLATALQELNECLYGNAKQAWRGESLWLAITGIAPMRAGPKQSAATLPPLYPS